MHFNSEIVIAIDVMGGDNAPRAPILGANIALQKFKNLKFIFCGDSSQISLLIDELPELKKNSTIIHTNEVISSDAKPSVVLRQYKKSSMHLAIQAVVNGDAQGVISAGNTGVLMALSKLLMKTLPSIQRPAITACIPNIKSEYVMLDLGANVDCNADVLTQFAIMGNAYAKIALQKTNNIRVALLNVGLEYNKGSDELRKAHQKLSEGTNLDLNFIGYIEPDAMWLGEVDVVVCSGFNGNIALKSAEGVYKFLLQSFKKKLQDADIDSQKFLKIMHNYHPGTRNGAVFLGLNGVSVKSHGGADEKSFSFAIMSTFKLIASKTDSKIIKEINNFMHKFYA